jgi:uncharacterized protein (DUF2249 family)
MSAPVDATSAADAQAVEAVKKHHAQLAGALAVQVETLIGAAERGDLVSANAASDALVQWCDAELVPQALAEELAMYPRAHADPRARLLVDAMLNEHLDLVALVEEVRRASGPVRAAAGAQALRSLFDLHLRKKNEQILPLLAASGSASLADVLGCMPALLAGEDVDEVADRVESLPPAATSESACTCGHRERTGDLPELDARAVPHAIRPATIFGALDSLGAGGGMVLVAPHDPLPLLDQLEQRSPGLFSIDYLQRGPEAWRVRFVRA